MTFTKQLRQEADPIYQAIFNHPFIKGVGDGKIPKEALIHYVKADFEYLNAFMKIYGLAITKCEKREDIAFFAEQIEFVLHSEVHPHNNFCRYAGVTYEELQGYPLPPTADHYIKHMMLHAHQGTMGEILAALLPCPWTYFEIGKHLVATRELSEDHPFYEWITFYADNDVKELTEEMCNRLDKLAQEAGEAEKLRMRDAFMKSCQLELAFWEMAYIEEQWPVAVEEVKVNG